MHLLVFPLFIHIITCECVYYCSIHVFHLFIVYWCAFVEARMHLFFALSPSIAINTSNAQALEALRLKPPIKQCG